METQDVHIRKLEDDEPLPINLLLLADPSEQIVKSYTKRGETYVALCGDPQEPVGVYVLLPTRPETVELVNVAAAEDRQGKGIGRQLVMHAIETAKRSGYHTIEIGTGNSSVGQLALYQKCGFTITGVDRDFFVRHYPEPITENGIRCRDMIRLSMDL
ncbi:GNAT family N-acetyltransferase [Alteribacter lacisalsi]|uniref:GNAT family N-acetyltransferase n=1 Tax=Alteribacter lacisalsi TaxID=2045244 RepID=UPI001F00D74D|nr:GNAT family N-acetyltransferase [Alteribacter lacisalsi]